MWSAAACRRLCDLAGYCGFNEARQALQRKRWQAAALHIHLGALFCY
jgi:hypothetical protein